MHVAKWNENKNKSKTYSLGNEEGFRDDLQEIFFVQVN